MKIRCFKQPNKLYSIFLCSNVQEKSLLIMENLFYDYDIDNKFDLKGSLRNRLVDPNNQSGEETVLLDENLIQSMPKKWVLEFYKNE